MSDSDAVQVRLNEHERRLKNNDTDHKDFWSSIQSIRNRPPLWVGIMVTALASLCTGLIVAMTMS